MKRLSYILLGVLIGIVFTISAGAYAATNGLIGKKVTSEVSVKANGVTLTDKGAVIDSRTLLPVRTIAESLGATVAYEGGEVILTTTPGSTPTSEVPDSTAKIKELQDEIQKLTDSITSSQANLKEAQALLDGYKADPKAADMVKAFEWTVSSTQEQISKYETQKTDLEAQLQALQQ